MSDWKIVERDGNPKSPGMYPVIIIYPEYNTVPTGRTMAEVAMRYYSPPCEEHDGWTMDGEDPDQYHWTEQTGSYYQERVFAWLTLPEFDVSELPEGVIME